MHDQPYLLAEKKIEESRCSGTMELDLSRMELAKLPESLGQLTQLHSLNLSKNKFLVVPKPVEQLTTIRFLDLSNNALSELPLSFANLWLSELNLDNNPLNPELAEAYAQGLDAVQSYLRAKVLT